jgi:hypothetical protein
MFPKQDLTRLAWALHAQDESNNGRHSPARGVRPDCNRAVACLVDRGKELAADDRAPRRYLGDGMGLIFRSRLRCNGSSKSHMRFLKEPSFAHFSKRQNAYVRASLCAKATALFHSLTDDQGAWPALGMSSTALYSSHLITRHLAAKTVYSACLTLTSESLSRGTLCQPFLVRAASSTVGQLSTALPRKYESCVRWHPLINLVSHATVWSCCALQRCVAFVSISRSYFARDQAPFCRTGSLYTNTSTFQSGS